MSGQIIADARECAGCLTCQMVCSFKHNDEFNSSKANVHVIYGDDCCPIDIVFDEIEHVYYVYEENKPAVDSRTDLREEMQG